jgi:hypothetical protein
MLLPARMYVGISNPQATLTGREWLRIRRILFVLPLAVLLAPVLPIVALLAYALIFPAHSASVVIPELEARLLLRFYYTWGDESGRHLTVATPRGHLTINMTAFDWAHNSRTSVYLTPDNKLAVLGPTGDDYVVSLHPPNSGRAFRLASETWTYLGAFDYDLSHGARALRFVTAAEQAECIPMLMEVVHYDWAPRNAARQRSCKHYVAPGAG